jgi:hypothetical protein
MTGYMEEFWRRELAQPVKVYPVEIQEQLKRNFFVGAMAVMQRIKDLRNGPVEEIGPGMVAIDDELRAFAAAEIENSKDHDATN